MMVSRKLFFVCLLLCFLAWFNVCRSDPVTYNCPNHTTYDINSISGRLYRKNLDSLLSALTSNASQRNGFYNYTSGGVYGLFLCRGDVKVTDCEDCLNSASSEVLGLCPNGSRADIWYDKCMLRYSDESIFSRMDTSMWWNIPNSGDVTDTASFNQVLADAFDKIANSAAKDDSGKKFAVEEANFTSTQKVYALGQCTPDLTNFECDQCLRNSISNLPSCCSKRLGGRVIYRSCNIRYEPYPFYQVSKPPPNPLPAPPLPSPSNATSKDNGGFSMGKILAIVIPAIVVLIMFFFIAIRRVKETQQLAHEPTDTSSIPTNVESLHFKLSEVQACTKNFAVENKIGEGGFGPVYKGTLVDGQIVAVKRLSRRSTQGIEEFINEIALVAKLQHRNLVRLMGYCLEGEEKLLIYEYVPNKSLDYFLFDPNKQSLLNWPTRHNIIDGIAKGLLYLHEDSRLKIIHRDLKASNVLLDENMNPKITDFGIAKLFETDQYEENTNNIAGTFGYMAPEYVFRGRISVKSDVFSFGVLVLEIISGNKNSSFRQSNGSDDLLSYSWKLWRDGKPLELLDPSIGDSSHRKYEVIRCVQIGLLCVQKDVELRPTMASVVLMLSNSSFRLAIPTPPPFFGNIKTGNLPTKLIVAESSDKASTGNSSLQDISINEASITQLFPR